MSERKRERRRALALLPEIRHFQATDLEVRSEAKTDQLILRGSPVVYNTPYTVHDCFGSFRETMLPGVASNTLARGADIRFLFDHTGLPLARSSSGTMSVTDTSTELRFTAVLDARQQLANDLYIAVERGDVSQLSVGFVVARDEWPDEETRIVRAWSEFLDISAVTYPASPATSVQVAQRMALGVPVESRARVRRALQDVAAGKRLSKDKLAALRSIVSDDTLGSAPSLAPSSATRRAPRRSELSSADRIRAEMARLSVRDSHSSLIGQELSQRLAQQRRRRSELLRRIAS